MPKFVSGVNLFKQPKTASNTVYIATTNSEVVRDCLIMGGGSARDMREMFKGIDHVAADVIKDEPDPNSYGFLRLTLNCGIFQTKALIRDPSRLDLIKKSSTMLAVDAIAYPNWDFRLPFPGIGLGGLRREDVLPFVESLPDNVVIYEI